MGRWASVWLVLSAGVGSAAPRVAVHPLVVLGGDARAVEQSRVDFTGQAAKLPIQMVSRPQVAEVLARQPGGACRPESEGCLETLCRETKASYALLITLMLDGPNFVLGARVLAANGTFVKTVEALTIEKDLFSPRSPQVQAAFKKLFAQLDLGSLPEVVPAKPAVVAAPVVTPPAPAIAATPGPVAAPAVEIPVVTREASTGTSSVRVAGLVIGAVALGTAGVATGFAMSASSSSALLKTSLEQNNNLLPRAEVERAKSVDRNTAIATGLYVGAGVAAAASLAMILVSIEWSSPVAIAPVEGGAMVGVTGTF